MSSDPSREVSSLLVTLRRIAFQAIDKRCFGGSENKPIMSRLLQSDEELLTAGHRFLVYVFPSLEPSLKRELTAQRMVSAAFAPDTDVRVGGDPLAEVEYPEVLENLLDNSLVHEFDPIVVGGLQRC